jgi:hypothetical protein
MILFQKKKPNQQSSASKITIKQERDYDQDDPDEDSEEYLEEDSPVYSPLQEEDDDKKSPSPTFSPTFSDDKTPKRSQARVSMSPVDVQQIVIEQERAFTLKEVDAVNNLFMRFNRCIDANNSFSIDR